jgi:hypothetical protein
MVNIFALPLFREIILPFLLVFVVVFAILQKTKVLGDGKTQMDSLVALVIGILLIITPAPRDFIVNFTPWVAVGAAVILVFLLLYGFVAEDSWKKEKWVKITFGILAGLFVLGLVIYFSGIWKLAAVKSLFSSAGSESLWANVLLIVVAAAALTIALVSNRKTGEKKDKS